MSDIGLLVSAKSYHSDEVGFKNRPGLVIGEYQRDYLLVFISKEVEKYRSEPVSLLLNNEHLVSGKLKHSSIVRSHKTYWAEKSRCTKIGRVKPVLLDRVMRLHQSFHVKNYHEFAHVKQSFIPGKSYVLSPIRGHPPTCWPLWHLPPPSWDIVGSNGGMKLLRFQPAF